MNLDPMLSSKVWFGNQEIKRMLERNTHNAVIGMIVM